MADFANLMDRRDFLRTAGTLLAASTLPGIPAAAEKVPTYGRAILPINRGWRYHPAQVAGAESPEFDDSSFERVVIPHTNIRLPWHSFDDKDYEFISTYRRRLRFPQDA